MRVPVNDDLLDARGAREKGAFDADAIAGHTADRKIAVPAVVADADHRSLENLDTFAVSFFNSNMHIDDITRLEFRHILVDRSFYRFQNFMTHNIHLVFKNKTASRGAARDYNMGNMGMEVQAG